MVRSTVQATIYPDRTPWATTPHINVGAVMVLLRLE
jgi:hypothetical protein